MKGQKKTTDEEMLPISLCLIRFSSKKPQNGASDIPRLNLVPRKKPSLFESTRVVKQKHKSQKQPITKTFTKPNNHENIW